MQYFKDTFLDKRLFLIIFAIYSLAYVVDFTSTLIIQSYGSSSENSLSDLIGIYLVGFIIKLIYILGSVWAASRLIYSTTSVIWSIIFHLLAAFLLSFYTAYFSMLSSHYLFGSGTSPTIESIWVRGLNGMSFNFFVYLSILGIVHTYYYLHKNKTIALESERLKRMMLDAKINALQSQLQPHFLFNAMNDISALMDVDVILAQDAIADLSNLLRKTLNIKDEKLISLRNELDILDSYLNIEKIRYGEKISVDIQTNIDANLIQIPPLTLQPFVENIVKHGFGIDHDSIKINISILKQDRLLVVLIENDGKPIPSDKQVIFGNGISNVLSRLETLYTDKYSFSITNSKRSDNKTWVQVRITLPLQDKDVELIS